MKKKYFLKYRPIEGDLTTGDVTLDAHGNLDVAINPDNPGCRRAGIRKAVLCLCTKHLEAGDTIFRWDIPIDYGRVIITEKLLGTYTLEMFLWHDKDPIVTTGTEVDLAKWAKCIGPISGEPSELRDFRDGEELDEDQVNFEFLSDTLLITINKKS